MWGPAQNLGLIGSAVLSFVNTNVQPHKQTPRQAKYICRWYHYPIWTNHRDMQNTGFTSTWDITYYASGEREVE